MTTEAQNQAKTFSNQSKLNRLPVPKLEDTLATLLKTVEPLAQSAEEFETFKTQVQDFSKAGGLGEALQKRLHFQDLKSENNWLEEWWLRDGYLTYREPSLINVNWGCVGKDHPNRPQELEVASQLIHHLLRYHELLNNEEITPIGGKFPQCMNQLKYLFGTCRVPDAGKDRIEHKFPTTASHISILIEGQVYSLEVYHLVKVGDKYERRMNSIEQITFQLTYLIHHLVKPADYTSITKLTAAHRDDWLRLRNSILQFDQDNLKAFESIQSSLFAVCLDNYDVAEDYTSLFKNAFHGQFAYNRWVDKFVNFIISKTGRVNIIVEHSPIDAMDLLKMLDWSLTQVNGEEVDLSLIKNGDAINWDQLELDTDFHIPEHLVFKLNDSIKDDIKQTEDKIHKFISNSDTQALHFRGFGNTKILEHSNKVTLDGFLQLALQLTYYLIIGEFAPVYESCGTRNYLNGRTETIRAFSSEAKAFLKWVEPIANGSTKLDSANIKEGVELIQKACEQHKNYTKLCLFGKGIDRHLFGLRKLLKTNESHPLLDSQLLQKSSTWKLSTSTLYEFQNMMFVGFGRVAHEGFGICYNHQKDSLNFSIESKRDELGKIGGTSKFIEVLEKNLNIIMDVLVKGNN
ncbi:acyltransferase ChoActase/COT/CPT [Conidiobolus coronatus NRRL 28638]|uniref:Acyltransferase ChoActase/COT/CPT n=1 Tax=Conidiobolus coronatus (strain ATCC 28846 / CBS 209.66 / NRRL 28638) TaxID=796925 RepID=A0A137PGY4_CONC2|nr:acyltransferase ChoActase/COT/CPT [Conidiobolus coronatus NRRL 28638]|eukprot:KXN74201.1 acyltransferase ChoActase/COT/CPT [Conidiobolus coronatus NRRL 28638]